MTANNIENTSNKPYFIDKSTSLLVQELQNEIKLLNSKGVFFTDSHSHITKPYYSTYAEVVSILENAFISGVNRVIAIGTTVDDSQENIDIMRHVESLNLKTSLYSTVGLHPGSVHEYKDEDSSAILKLSEAKNVIGIGEIGLDYHYSDGAEKSIQHKAFTRQLEVALEVGKPVVIHNRDSSADVMKILQEVYCSDSSNKGGIIHCFPGDPDLLDFSINNNFYISYSGNSTYKKAEIIRDAISNTPLDRLLIETDAPYLTPSPYRGKMNEAMYTIYIANTVAAVKGISLEEVAVQTEVNIKTLFPDIV